MKKYLYPGMICFTILTSTYSFSQTNTFPASGNVGIGTTSPQAPMQIVAGTSPLALFSCTNSGNNAITITNTLGQLNLGVGSAIPHAYIWSGTNKLFIGNDDGNPTMFFDGMGFGKVGIGTTTPQEKLTVNGNIRSKKVIVTQLGWPDYVFHKTYRLRPLSEVEQYIHQHQHLPEIPSAAEIEKEGVDLGDNQAALLKKIEELTLYIIDLNKEVNALKKEIRQGQVSN